MISIQPDDTALFLPKPFYLVVEDVGWWQGHDGSALNEPYRNNVPRRHCIKDYEALRHLAQRLSMRIALAMVLGEWDRNNFLRNVPGATWMGCSWDNSANQGPWLDQAAQFLIEHDKYLEIAMHGLCHEYWTDGRMQRSEFHDDKNHMREQAILRIHLDAYGKLLRQNGLPYSPRLFIPPALHHSFGNGDESMQALLYSYGVDHVTTRFDRARQIRPLSTMPSPGNVMSAYLKEGYPLSTGPLWLPNRPGTNLDRLWHCTGPICSTPTLNAIPR